MKWFLVLGKQTKAKFWDFWMRASLIFTFFNLPIHFTFHCYVLLLQLLHLRRLSSCRKSFHQELSWKMGKFFSKNCQWLNFIRGFLPVYLWFTSGNCTYLGMLWKISSSWITRFIIKSPLSLKSDDITSRKSMVIQQGQFRAFQEWMC